MFRIYKQRIASVEAVKFDGTEKMLKMLNIKYVPTFEGFIIDTRSGMASLKKDDYLVKEPDLMMYYPVVASIFETKYELTE